MAAQSDIAVTTDAIVGSIDIITPPPRPPTLPYSSLGAVIVPIKSQLLLLVQALSMLGKRQVVLLQVRYF